MTGFDESKVITSLHKDKAVIGRRYYASDNFVKIKGYVERRDWGHTGELRSIDDAGSEFPFTMYTVASPCMELRWQLLYPCEPRVRPFEMVEEVDAAVKEHGHIVRSLSSNCRYVIKEYYKDSDVRVTVFRLGTMPAAAYLDKVEFTDGAPFGVEE